VDDHTFASCRFVTTRQITVVQTANDVWEGTLRARAIKIQCSFPDQIYIGNKKIGQLPKDTNSNEAGIITSELILAYLI